MHNYRSILLASLLMAGVAMNNPPMRVHSETLPQHDFEQQSLAEASESDVQKDCPYDGQSPPPGCGRRDKDMTKDNGLRG
jgi:hypothetical protein